jgi:outer membrane lipoprotein SlyB
MPYNFQKVQPDEFLKMGQALQGQAISASSNMNNMKTAKADAPKTVGGALGSAAGGALAGWAVGGPYVAAAAAVASTLAYYLS